MKRTRATAGEVAKLAGVSQPTVSRVFTPGSRVSPDKVQRVREAARELGYLPNTLARSLNSGRSYTIGIVLAYLKNQFYPDALQKLSERLSERGYHVMVFFATNLDDEVDGVVDDLLAHQVDGIILASVSMSNHLTARLLELKMPFVLFNRGQDDKTLPSVTAENFQGGRIAGRFLAAAGHKRIAHIAGWKGSLNGRDRQAGFIAGLGDYGMKPFAITDSHFRRRMAINATRELFEGRDVPDAIFVGNDHMAIAVLETVRCEIGLRVPEDVSIIGFDDVPMSAWKLIDLTTIRQPVIQMVNECVEMLLGIIEHNEVPKGRLEVKSKLIIRGSARIPDNWPPRDGHLPLANIED